MKPCLNGFIDFPTYYFYFTHCVFRIVLVILNRKECSFSIRQAGPEGVVIDTDMVAWKIKRLRLVLFVVEEVQERVRQFSLLKFCLRRRRRGIFNVQRHVL